MSESSGPGGVAEELPFEPQAWLSAIVTSAEDAIVGKTLDGNIVSWNPAAERIFGYRPEEILGQPITVLADPARPTEMAEILDRLRTGDIIAGYETTRQRKDGSILPVSLTISPIRSVKGDLIGASKIARDITEKKKREEQVRLLSSDLEHRLKNILSMVAAFIRVTKRNVGSPALDAIEDRIMALDRACSLLGAGEWQHAKLDALILELIHVFDAGNDRFVIGGPSISLGAEAVQALSMALNELGTNAIKYGALSGEGGTVEIGWEAQSDVLRITWREKGGPPTKAPSARGVGHWVLRSSVEGQLGGTLRMDWPETGVVCEITIPARHVYADGTG